MSTTSTTYTMLVTIAHDAGAAPSTELLESMVQRDIEEGVREFAGVYAATVSVLAGDHLQSQIGVATVKKLHRELRA